MELIRTIHPVGQGGFYTEKLLFNDNEFNVVYDCGGSSKRLIEAYLHDYLRTDGPKKVIDAVFISHLHEDHINGLEYLLRNAVVKHLILPQLTNDLLLETLVYNRIHLGEEGNELNHFVLSFYGGHSQYDTRVVKILQVDDNSRIEAEEGINLTIGLKQNSFKSGSIFHIGDGWMYIPFNPRVFNKRNHGFYDYFKGKLGLDDFMYRDLPKVFLDHEEECKKAYQNYFGSNHNAYSMTLFSGEEASKDRLYIRNRYIWHYCKRPPFSIYSPNCLYTGDFEIGGIDAMKRFYSPLWDSICSIQVPHHGSRRNYLPDLYDHCMVCFLSAGEHNRFHHPNLDTLVNIMDMGCFPLVVTEDPRTKTSFML